MTDVETTHDYADYWGIHSSTEQRPVFRGWAASEQDANTRLEEIRKADGDNADQEYWVARMFTIDLEDYQRIGVIPKDA